MIATLREPSSSFACCDADVNTGFVRACLGGAKADDGCVKATDACKRMMCFMYLQEVKGAEAMGEREREEEAVSPPVIPFD